MIVSLTMSAFVRRLRRSIRRIRRANSFGELIVFGLRSVSWTLHVLTRRPATIRLGSTRARLRLPAEWGQGGAALFILRGRYEPEISFVEKTLSPGEVFVDGGANLGIYTVLASSAVGHDGRVLSFEPGAETFERLRRSIAAGEFDNVTPFCKALSDHVGSARLYHTQNHMVSYSLTSSGDEDNESEPVETITIDEAVAQAGLDRLDFIKLDIEGAEEAAMRGASGSIDRWKPIILFEFMPDAPIEEGSDRIGAWNYLAAMDYRFGVVDGDGRLVRADTPQVGNNIAIPPHKEHVFAAS